jgi:hypothetical protein
MVTLMQTFSITFSPNKKICKGSIIRGSFFHAVMLGILISALGPGSLSAQELRRPLGPWDFMARMGVSAYTGYFGHRDAVNMSFSAPAQPSGSVQRLRQQFRLEGISTEMLFPIRAAGPVGIVLGAGISGCFPSLSEEIVQRSGSGSEPLSRTWKIQPQAGNIHAALAVDVLPSVLGLIGFRYETFQTKFFDPNSGFGNTLGTLDSANLAYNAYLPCLGFVLGVPALFPGLNVQLGFVGCPVLLGSVDYRETWNNPLNVGGKAVNGFTGSNPIGKGSFFDAFGEVSLVTCCGVEIGAYAKYEFMRGTTPVWIGQGNNALPTVVYDFDFQKRLWGIGGRVSISF